MSRLDLVTICVLANVLARPSWIAAFAFACVAAYAAFADYLNRSRKSESQELKDELTQLKNKVDGLMVAKGFGR
jgi:hypothetical protein